MLELTPLKYYWLIAIAWHTFKLFDNVIRTKNFGKYSIETASGFALKGWFKFRNRVVLYTATGFLINALLLWTFWRCYCCNQQPFFFMAYLQQFIFPSEAPIQPEIILVCLILYIVHLGCRMYTFIFICVHSWREEFNVVYVAVFNLNEIVLVLSLVAEAPDFSTYKDCFSYNIDWMKILPVVVMLYCLKIRSDSLDHLKSLRKNKAGHIVTTAYKQPKGSYFETLNLSNPHHFAELLIHLSIATILGLRAQTWLLVCFKLSIHLLDRSISAHNFYRNKFEDYGETRKILIPFLL